MDWKDFKDVLADWNNIPDIFKKSVAVSANDIDFSAGAIFTKTLAADTTLTFSNYLINRFITLIVSGDFTLTLPASVTISGEYDGTVDNYIHLQCVDADTPAFWAVIRQEGADVEAASPYAEQVALSPADSAALLASFEAGQMNGKYARITTSDDLTITIPSTTDNIPVNTEGVIEQTGAGTITFAAGAGATVVAKDSALSTGGQYDMIFWKNLNGVFIIHGGS